MKRPIPLVCALLLLLQGCAAWQTDKPVTPTSYKEARGHIPRNVGKLRRLAILPIVQQAPRACGRKTDGESEVAPTHISVDEVADFLSKRRGYDIVLLDPARYGTWFDNAANGDFRKEVTEWSAGTQEDAAVGVLASAFTEEVGRGDSVDGVLLLLVQDSCARANSVGRTALGIASLGVSEVLVDPKLQEIFPIYRVAIIEAATKRAVWRNSMDMAWSGLRTHFSLSGEKKPFSDYLFKDLEPSLPKLLTR